MAFYLNHGTNQTTPTWNQHLLHGELHPGGHGSQGVLDAVVEQEGVEGQAAGVDDGSHQVLRVVEEGQGAHVPVHERAGQRQTNRSLNLILALSLWL